jgi:hypothetical protein
MFRLSDGLGSPNLRGAGGTATKCLLAEQCWHKGGELRFDNHLMDHSAGGLDDNPSSTQVCCGTSLSRYLAILPRMYPRGGLPERQK